MVEISFGAVFWEGGRYSSMGQSTPTFLWPRVRIARTRVLGIFISDLFLSLLIKRVGSNSGPQGKNNQKLNAEKPNNRAVSLRSKRSWVRIHFIDGYTLIRYSVQNVKKRKVFKTLANPGLFLFMFFLLKPWKTVNVLGIRTLGHRMLGTNGVTELPLRKLKSYPCGDMKILAWFCLICWRYLVA